MKESFHYVVKVKLIRYQTNDDVNFIEHEKSFRSENPLKAREEAFKEYQAWINDLLEGQGKGKVYSTDKQARIDLQSFLNGNEANGSLSFKKRIDFDNSLGLGIGVYFVIDKPYYPSWENSDNYDKVGDEYLIHGIGATAKYNDPLEISDALNVEILYYEYYNYDKGVYDRKANIYDWDTKEIEEIHFLETPFDWTGFDTKPEKEDLRVYQIIDKNIEKIIANGEGNQVEFKPALLYNFKTDKAGISVKGKIATAICSFLNSNGGVLFIGLNNDGKSQGLEKDFSLSDIKNQKDFFQNEFDQMIEHFLSFSVKSHITGQFYELEGKDIFIVFIEPSKNRAIFVKGQNGKEFWVRGNAGNRQLIDIEELANYCIDRWSIR